MSRGDAVDLPPRVTPTEVDYLVIGGGIAGLTLCRFLTGANVVCLEPQPCRFKLGEAISPDHFDHPALRGVAAQARQLPSWADKRGSIFVFDGCAAAYPAAAQAPAMHIRRDELEAMLIDAWRPPLRRERAVAIDLERKLVRTDRGAYRVRHQILDCSGPAMVVARALGAVRRLWDVYCSWVYLDVLAIDDPALEGWLAATGRELHVYDAKTARALSRSELGDWRPSHYTYLRNVRDGSWIWQIPLYGRREISFGMTSVHGPVGREDLRAAVAAHLAPMFHARLKTQDGRTPHHRFHVRNHYALRAGVAATMDYVLLGDAYYFGDPIYATGTTTASADAVDVAEALNTTGWTEAVCRAYNARKAEVVDRAVAVHYFSPHNTAADLEREAAAVDGTRQLRIHTVNYASIIAQTKVALGTDRERGSMFESPYRADPTELLAEVSARLDLGAARRLDEWTLRAASSIRAGGVELTWSAPDRPTLTVLLRPYAGVRDYYRRFGAMTLSYMNAFDRPYPLDGVVEALFDALGARLAGWSRWAAAPASALVAADPAPAARGSGRAGARGA